MPGSLLMITGKLTVLCGPMFAGKTEGLIDRVLTSKGAIRIYKPTIDTRYSTTEVISHAGRKVYACWVSPQLDGVEPGGAVAIDEAQFLDPRAVEVVAKLVANSTKVILTGLDLDCFGLPFGPMPTFISMADEVVRLQARCSVCGQGATRTYRKVASSETVLVGGANLYEPRCVPCWEGTEVQQAAV